MSNPFCKRTLLICAALLALVALMVALAIVPAAKSDSSAGAVPDKAVSAFWLNFGLSLLAAIGCTAFAIRSKSRSRFSTSVLVALGLIVLVLGLALADAASAYRSHDGLMQSVSTLLFVGAALDLIAGALVFTVAFMRSRGERQV